MNRNYDVLSPYARKHPDWETRKAEDMFNHFLKEGFSYDDISNHPDYLSCASAEMLLDMIPWIIDEMLKRNDTINYLIYPVIMNLDLLAYTGHTSAQERVKKIITLGDVSFAKEACRFLDALKDEPPIDREDFDRVHKFWEMKLKELS